MSDDVRVRGGASPEEVAAVLALVRGRYRPVADDPLRRWQRLRQAVTKPT
jgi:hypothetical protein